MINSIRKQTVQGMAKFVEESRHLVEGQQGRLVATWRSKVTYNGDHRMNKVAFLIDLLLAVTAHPGTNRKSTRLNSSHVRISYAVFCLKKKKNNKINDNAFYVNTNPVVNISTILLCHIASTTSRAVASVPDLLDEILTDDYPAYRNNCH